MKDLKMPPYIYTASGLKFTFSAPTQKSITIEDIAHQLAQTNRWGGCTREPFSVAQHSCLMAEMVEGTMNKKIALMHDAAEAYLGDMPRPLKVQSPEFQAFEKIAMEAILKRFNLPALPMPSEVKEADNLLLAWEAEVLMPKNCYDEHFIQFPSYPAEMEGLLVPWSWKTAKSTFLARFKLLFG